MPAKPSAFIVIPFTPMHKQLYDQVIKKALEKEGYEIIRSDQIPAGEAFIRNTFAGIDRCNLVIGVVSGSNPNVMYELGYAERLGRPTILLTDEPSNIPADIRHINHFVYGKESSTVTKERLIEWIHATGIGGRFRKNTLLNRGDILDHVVDSAFYLQKTRPVPSKHEIAAAFRDKHSLAQHLLYITEDGLSSYLDLCADPEYDYYIETTKTIAKHKQEIIESILSNAQSSEIDFISLGPGNGHKDAVLLDEFCKKAKPNKFIYYYPYDISGGMLLEAARTVINKRLPLAKFKLKAIEADFRQLSIFRSVFDYRAEPNVFSLLGSLNCIGSEVALLKTVRSIMDTRDTLILEVRKRNTSGAPAAMGQKALNVRLDVSALRYIGAQFNSEHLVYIESEQPNDISETVTFVGKLPSVELGDEVFTDVELFQIEYYDSKSITKKLDDMGFRRLLTYETENSLFWVLGKTLP